MSGKIFCSFDERTPSCLYSYSWTALPQLYSLPNLGFKNIVRFSALMFIDNWMENKFLYLNKPLQGMALTECLLSACMLPCLPSQLLACLFASLLACLPASLPASLLLCLLACLLHCLLACLLSCLLACPRTPWTL